MKRSVLIAIGMAVLLFLYGYSVTELGHDHDSHDDDHAEHTESR